MDYIDLSGTKYPLRFDLRALNEYKSLTNNDILVRFEQTTENVIHLAYVAMKSGSKFDGRGFELTSEKVSELLEVKDLKVFTKIFLSQIGKDDSAEESGELKPQ